MTKMCVFYKKSMILQKSMILRKMLKNTQLCVIDITVHIIVIYHRPGLAQVPLYDTYRHVNDNYANYTFHTKSSFLRF